MIRLRNGGVTRVLRRLRDRARRFFERRGSLRARKAGLRVAFFAPALLLLVLFVGYPVLATIGVSFFDANGHFVGFANYGNVLGSPDTINLNGFPKPPPYGRLIISGIWIAINLPLSVFLGMWLALVLQEVRGAVWVKTAIFIGMVTPLVIGGIMMLYVFDGAVGIVPRFFDSIGIHALGNGWLQRPTTLLFGLIFGSVWLWIGFSLIVYSAGLTTIPKEYWEAAQMDGASAWQTFRKVTWPLLRPTTLTVVTMTILWELKLFDIVFAATNPNGGVGGAADVLALQMFRYAFMADGNFNDAAVVATLLTGLTLLVSAWMFKRIIIGPSKKAGRFKSGLIRLWARMRPHGTVLKA